MTKKKLILVCNAHLDPVWLWEWEEGLAETLSTFRIAAKFCEEFEGFVFCHNESLLYQWTEIYEPALFEQIRKLVADGKWHIMGGWYVQPDCNMPAGESFVRQILQGKNYFKEKFGVEPKTAINFDPFGHTRGLVQILKKSGYNSYLFCRPDVNALKLDSDDFVWVGYDGSEILARRASEHYNSAMGKLTEKINGWIEKHPEAETGMMLWGIGNHGGGPSRIDLESVERLKGELDDWELVHGTPEQYFSELEKKKDSLPRREADLNPWAVGCYTSMSLVKKFHRRLENFYFQTEKMVAHAHLLGLMDYPKNELREALEDLLFCQFHDILPGSAIKANEDFALQKMNHGIEILDRLRSQAIFRMIAGFAPAQEEEFPIFVYNPFPYDVTETVEIEFQPPEPNFDWQVELTPEIFDENGNQVTFQVEKERSNIQVDHRKHVVFRALLKASSVTRFTCFLRKKTHASPKFKIQLGTQQKINVPTERGEVVINCATGLLEKYDFDGTDYLKDGAGKLLLVSDYPDPWGMVVTSFRNVEEEFQLMTAEESADFAGISDRKLAPVRIIENGEIRTVVEALFKCRSSQVAVRYFIDKKTGDVEMRLHVFWLEKDKMLKLAFPTNFSDGACWGQVAYGREKFAQNGEELVAQKWVAVTSSDEKKVFAVINDGTYGFDCKDGEMRMTLLRSAAYAAHPVASHIPIVRQDRFEPRIDQGEREFRFWIRGADEQLLENIDLIAQMKNEPPVARYAFPDGTGKKLTPAVILSDERIQLTALKMAENQNWLIARLFEPTGQKRKTTMKIPALNIEKDLKFGAFEIKTVAIDLDSKEIFETDLLERKDNDEK